MLFCPPQAGAPLLLEQHIYLISCRRLMSQWSLTTSARTIMGTPLRRACCAQWLLEDKGARVPALVMKAAPWSQAGQGMVSLQARTTGWSECLPGAHIPVMGYTTQQCLAGRERPRYTKLTHNFRVTSQLAGIQQTTQFDQGTCPMAPTSPGKFDKKGTCQKEAFVSVWFDRYNKKLSQLQPQQLWHSLNQKLK